MKKMSIKRQGELLIVKISKLPKLNEELKKQTNRTLAEGETTGHTHPLDKGTLYKAKMGTTWQPEPDKMFFEIPKKQVATLTHPEHKSLTFPQGLYEVITQREYSEKGIMRVRD